MEADLLAFELHVATAQGAVHIRVFSSDAMQARVRVRVGVRVRV